MFFSTYVLTKKGPLAKIWLAAHWDKKLTRNEIRAIDLNQTIVQIVQPVVPIALRTSGELLIGVVRVYALKVKQLLKDATEATVLLRTTNIQVVPKGMVKGGDHAKDAVAVTMDVVLSKGGVAPEDLCEADFDGIADLLRGGKGPAGHKGRGHDDDEVVGSAWFTLEPSQYLEEQLPDSQNIDDGLARIRADLLALGDENRRAESTGSKSKSSVSSVEKGRTSHMVLGDDMLDIGVPLPDDLLLSGIPDAADPLFENLMMGAFDVPDVAVPEAGAGGEQFRLPKKLKVVNVLDSAATVLSKADVEKALKDRSDIVNEERRMGPVSAEEERDRTVLRAAETTVVSLDPISFYPNPALRAVFSSALRASVSKVQDEVEASRASQKAAERGSGKGTALPDDMFVGDGMDVPAPEFDFGLGDVPQLSPEERGRTSRGKRAREEDGGDKPFSASTIATLETLKGMLRSTPDTTFAKFAKGMRRLETARAFVDVLALASHSVVGVRQAEPFGEIKLLRTAQLAA